MLLFGTPEPTTIGQSPEISAATTRAGKYQCGAGSFQSGPAGLVMFKTATATAPVRRNTYTKKEPGTGHGRVITTTTWSPRQHAQYSAATQTAARRSFSTAASLA